MPPAEETLLEDARDALELSAAARRRPLHRPARAAVRRSASRSTCHARRGNTTSGSGAAPPEPRGLRRAAGALVPPHRDPLRAAEPGGALRDPRRHPVLCREYDPRSWRAARAALERRRLVARRAEDLEQWLERTRPAHWRRLLSHREIRPQGPPRAGRDGAGWPRRSSRSAIPARTNPRPSSP